MNKLIAVIALLFSLMASTAATAQERGYYQTPALHGDTLIFASEGDLWRGRLSGGTAVRLTTHAEVEDTPILSPDGQWIAFMASYDGPEEVYMVSVNGGTPKRLTHEGGGVLVRGWMDNERVIYRTSNISGRLPRILRTIDRATLTVTDLPFDNADEIALSEGSSEVFFTRYGLAMFADNAVLYRGGRMAQLWRGDLDATTEAARLAAEFGAPIRHPMIADERLYFVSDKSGADNIWSMDLAGGDLRQHTNREQWQLRTPYLHDSTIVFQSGADFYAYDIEANTVRQIDLYLMSDGDTGRTRWIDEPLSYLEDAHVNAQGDAVAVTARGRVATAFTGQQRRIDYRFPAEDRVRSAVFDADGDTLFAILDADDRGEIWSIPANGQGEAKQVTQDTDAYIWSLIETPHADTLLYTDKKARLVSLDTLNGETNVIDRTQSSFDQPFYDFAWSGGGRYLAYTYYDERDLRRVAIYDRDTDRVTSVTTGKFESFAPAFSADGAWLYFVSNRNFSASPGSPWGDRNMGPAFESRGQIFAVQLDPSAEFPFDAANELTAKPEDDDEEDEEDDAGEADLALDGIADRLFQVPVPAGEYGALAANEKYLFVYSYDDAQSLQRIEISSDDPSLSDYTSGVERFALTDDGSSVFVQTGSRDGAKFVIVPANKDFPSDTSSQTVRLSDWTIRIDPKKEWRQLVLDAWRLHRDFAYDPNLRGVDWSAVRDHYVPLRDRIGHRSEVNDLLKQMAAELGILHSQVRGGDAPSDEESGTPSFLGATYETTRRGLRIASIYAGEPDRPATLSPLQRPGVDVQEGDILRAIDGRSIKTQAELADALMMKAGEEVLLELLRGRETIYEIVEPRTRWSTLPLHYSDWVERNRARVAEASDGQVGYLHLRAMTASNAASFARDFYEHYDKGGLIIDVRGNSGGNIDSMLLSALLRQSWAFWRHPDHGRGYTNMQQTFRGHLAVLINEGTYSDGETFAAGIKALDLGATIGTQTAGAGIWLSDRNPLSDRGRARIAEYAQYGADGRWLIEGRGVSPDIEVINPPRATYQGEDAQLDYALSYLADKMAAEPLAPLAPQPLPKLGETGQDVD
ncbi:MAG: S41 family peptidase [Pseudomonadota bacterium]